MSTALPHLKSLTNPLLVLTDFKGAYRFSIDQIMRMQAKDNYTIVYFDGRPPFVVSKVLKTYESLLGPFGFVRTTALIW